MRHRLIIFGGFPVYLNDLWAFDLDSETWELISPSGTPPTPRYGPTAIYDAANDRVVVFGGFDGNVQRNDVHVVNLSGHPQWSAIVPSGTPPQGRSFHVAAYDEARQRMVMFSGWNGASQLGDTWELSLGGAPSWTHIVTPTSPLPRSLAAVAIDPLHDRLLVFGGWNEATTTYYDDTWALSLSGTQDWSEIPTSVRPPGRREISMIYDPIGDRIVILGGNGGSNGIYMSDCWSLALVGPSGWIPINAAGPLPAGRYGHASYYDPVGHNFFIFGGNSFEQHLNDLYRLNLSGQPQWTRVLGPPPPSTHAPEIADVRDVPHDQGGRVFVTWLASDLDVHGSDIITGYRVWRRIHPEGTAAGRAVAPAAQAANRVTPLRTMGANGTNTVFWEALVDLPAQKLEGYGYTAPTTQDSMKNSNPYTAFFITALTEYPGEFYSSDVDSGYSVDNIKPRKPRNPIAALEPSGFSIAWEAPDETYTPDVRHYRVYRGNTADFTPDATHQIGQTEELTFVDEGSIGAHYYKLTTVDWHENESDAETLGPLSPVAVGDAAAEFALRGSTPHPARPSNLTIEFSLAIGTRAMLELFDLGGRRVATRELGRLGAGVHRVNLAEGRALRAGVYLVRLAQGNLSRSLKAIVIP